MTGQQEITGPKCAGCGEPLAGGTDTVQPQKAPSMWIVPDKYGPRGMVPVYRDGVQVGEEECPLRGLECCSVECFEEVKKVVA